MSFFIFLVLLLILIWLISRAIKKNNVSSEIYRNRTMYADIEKPERAFFSKEFLLAGKPDSVLHTKNGLVPVEVKSSRRPKKPYYSHVMQLASYCLLLEASREKPKYGLIQYAGGEPFVVEYTSELKGEVIRTIREMRLCIRANKILVFEREEWKCERCGWKGECGVGKVDISQTL